MKVAIKASVKKDKSISGKYYKDAVLKKVKKISETPPCHWFKQISLLHDNAPAHTPAIVTTFLMKDKVTVLPPLSPCITQTLPHVIYFLFLKLKSFLTWRKFQSRQARRSVVHQYLITVPKSVYRDDFLKLCISSHRGYFEGMK